MTLERTWDRSCWPSAAALLLVAGVFTSCGSSSSARSGADGGSSLGAGAGTGSSGGATSGTAGPAASGPVASGAPTGRAGAPDSGAAPSRGAAPIVDAGPPGPTDGGAAPDDSGANPSSGCGGTTWPTASPQTVNVTDKAGNTLARQFYFALPSGYSPTHPYPLVFAWHYAGGQAATIAGSGFSGHYYGIQTNFPNAIYVAPQGLVGPAMADGAAGQTGWPNTNDEDVAFARAMVSWFEGNFCVDQSRLMAAGFSYGAIMSHTIACEMPDVFRAVGVMSGAFFGRAASCVDHDIAAWMTHGDADDMVAFTSGESARDRIVALNHCGSTTHDVTPSPCVQYDGCDPGFPVVWCPVADGGHAIPSFAATAIASFFSQF